MKRLKDGSHLYIATNQNPKQALNAYRRRWQIECLFGDSKTRSFNIEDTKITQAGKLKTLMSLVTLAMIWTYKAADIVRGKKPIKRKAHGYREKSMFRVGLDHLRRLLLFDHQKAIRIWQNIWPPDG